MATRNETLGELNPNERNPRRMSDVQRDALRKSLAEFGPLDGFIFNRRSKSLVGGHQRKSILADESKIVILERLKKPNAQGTIARGYVEANGERITYREVDWKPAKEKAGMIAANKHSGEWNETELAQILADLKTEDFDLDLTGFDENEFEKILGQIEKSEVDAEPQIDKAAELAAKWKVERGQIWELGNHRLMCGDSTNPREVGLLMNHEIGHAIFTDPPYGVGYDGGMKRRKELSADEVGTDIYLRSLPVLAKAVDKEAPLYLWYADGHAAAAAAAAAGYQITAQIIWAKNHAQFMTSAHYKGKHEPCYYGHKKNASARWHGPNNEITLWEYDRSPSNDFHPTQKPTELAARAIRNSTTKDMIVLDGFSGSGSTLIACEQLGRKCRAMEIDPGYVAVAIQRWVDATGKTPVKGGGPP